MTDEPLDLDAIKARVAAATALPWKAEYDHDEPVSDWGMEVYYAEERNEEDYAKAVHDGDIMRKTDLAIGTGAYGYGVFPVREADAIFIAAARTDVPALVAALRATRAALAQAEKWRDGCALPAGAFTAADAERYAQTSPAEMFGALLKAEQERDSWNRDCNHLKSVLAEKDAALAQAYHERNVLLEQLVRLRNEESP